MGHVININLDADTGNYIIKLAQKKGITPAELIRERIYQYFHIQKERKSYFLPRETYRMNNRIVIRVYLSDDVYNMLKTHLNKNRKTLASFIRELFAVVVDV